MLGENGWELGCLSFILCILFNKQFIDLHYSSRISQNSAFSANSSHDFGIASFNSFSSSRYRIYQSFPPIKQSHSQSQTRRFRLLSTSESLLFFSLLHSNNVNKIVHTLTQIQRRRLRQIDGQPDIKARGVRIRFLCFIHSSQNKQKRSDWDSKPRFQSADS